jgi:hypothetical protein
MLLQETNGKLSDPFIPRIRFKFSKLFFEGKIFAGAKRFSGLLLQFVGVGTDSA